MKLADSLPSFFPRHRKTLLAPRPVPLIEPLEARIAPATFTWINAAGGAWTTPGNWSVSGGADADGIPDADDDVTFNPAAAGALLTITGGAQAAHSISIPGDDLLQLTNAAFSLGADSSINGLLLSGGSLSVNGLLTLTGSGSSISGTTLAGSFLNNGVLALTGGTMRLDGATLNNAGTITQTGGQLFFQGTNPAFHNLAGALYEVNTAAGNGSFIGSAGLFDNAGTLRRDGSGLASAQNANFHNAATGVIEVLSGTLQLNSFGSMDGGVFNVSNGATLSLQGINQGWSGNFSGSGAGTISFLGGTISVNNVTLNFPTGLFQINGSTFSGGNVMNVGALLLTGGTIRLDGATLNNAGTITQTGGQLFFQGTNPAFHNLAGALYEVNSAAGNGSFIGSAGLFDNAGTLRRDGSGLASAQNANFHNAATGVIEVLNGTLQLNAFGSMDGGIFNVNAGATLRLEGINQSWSGNFSGGGAGTVLFQGGTITTNNVTLNFPSGMFQWATSGVITGGTLTNVGSLSLTGSGGNGIMRLIDATLNNAGTIAQTGGQLVLQGTNPALHNLAGGLYEVKNAGDGPFLSDSSATEVFDNAGTLRRDGSGTARTEGVNFSNTGTIDVVSGGLQLNSAVAQVSSGMLSGGVWKVAAGATLALPANITINNASVEIAGTAAQLDKIVTNNGTLNLRDEHDIATTGNFTNNGALSLGLGSVLTANGTFTSGADSRIEFQIGGVPASGSFGKLAVTGAATLAGQAQLAFVNGYVPAIGQVFQAATFASHTGTLAEGSGFVFQRTKVFDAQTNATSFTITAVANAADLKTTTVTASGSSVSGENVTVNFTVQNVNATSPTFTDAWTDSVYLSLDDQYDPSDKLIGRVAHAGTVAGGGSYNGSLVAPLPGAIPGAYKIIVVADSRGQMPDSNRVNNTGATAGKLTKSIPVLTPGVAVNGTIKDGQDIFYRVDLPPGAAPSFKTTFGVAGEAELYTRQNDAPDRATYDRLAFGPTDTAGQIVQNGAFAGTYYILLHGRENAGADAAFTLTAEGLPFGASTLSLDHGPNIGEVTTIVHGSQFTQGTTFSLVPGAGAMIAAAKTTIIDPGTAWVTFNLANAVIGDYGVKASDGAASATLANGFHITGAAGAKGQQFVFDISSPRAIRPPYRGTAVTLTYANTGDIDVPAPLMLIIGSNAKLKLADDPAFGGSYIQVLAANPDGPAGVLPPGAHGEITIAFEPVNATAHALSNFEALVSSSTGFTFDWDALKDDLQPPNIPNDAWDAIFTNYKAQVGTTAESLRAALADDATRLSAMGYHTNSVEKLIGYELEEADDFGAITSRNEIGALGRGQAGPLSIHAVADAAGNVTIINGDEHRLFFKNGSAFAGANDAATLARDNAGAFHLREVSGEETVFRASDGRLDRFNDGRGNSITAGYNTAGQIISAASSNGDTTTFSYNAQGRISKITDAVGRDTNFAYDAGGQHLTSATGPLGTTTFTYVTGQGAPREHAIASIAFPDGTSHSFQYDTRGRTVLSTAAGGALATSFSYDATGGFSVADAANQTSTFWHVPGGSIGRSFDALGHTTSVIPSGYGGNQGSVFADGTSLTTKVDSVKGLATLTNSLGQTTTYDYGGTPLRLDALINPRGVSTHFSYDSAGRVTDVTGPDGGVTHLTYDAHGNRTAFVNERNQTIGYVYDAHDILTRKNLPDGTHTDFSYDAHRNLLSASQRAADNSDLGTTSFEYDAADRVTKVTYPGGKFLNYTYDAAGRRATVSDGAFTERYHFDSLGRVDRVSDTADATIVTYAYDALNRLATETRGNGTTTTYRYDELNRTASIVHRAPNNSVTESFTYTYDAGSRVKTLTTLAGTTTYGYDLAGQLTSVALPGGRTVAYAYDANGNRTTVSDSAGGTTNFTANELDEYTAASGATLSYDPDGNLVSKSTAAGPTVYQYDAQGRITSLTTAADTFLYSYDALGNHIATTHNGVRTDYVIDPAGFGNVFAEYESGALVAHYAQGLGLESRIAANGQAAFYHYDRTGNTELLTGAGGAVLNTYEYLPFGEKIAGSGTAANAFTFNGRHGVEDRGDGLYDMRARSYDAALGRFTQRDPIGFLAGDTNVYRYVGNDPVNHTDPLGLIADALFLAAYGYLPVTVEQLAISAGLNAAAAGGGTALIAAGGVGGTAVGVVGGTAATAAGTSLVLSTAGGLTATGGFVGATGTGGAVGALGGSTAAGFATVNGVTVPVFFGGPVAGEVVVETATVGGAALGLPVALGGALILGATDVGLRILAPDLHDGITQTLGDHLPDFVINRPQDPVNHETENQVLNAPRAPQVQTYINQIANDPQHPTIEEISRSTRFARQESELSRWDDLRVLHNLFPSVYPDPGPPPIPLTTSENVLPGDPNNILGPGGFGADLVATDPHVQPLRFDGFTRADGSYGFTILFENMPTASAPAQHVVVTQTLDADLDLNTFALGSFGFGDFKADAPAGQSHFSTRIDARATLGIFVDVNAELNLNTRVLTVDYFSIDPETGDLPLDALTGFLPPNTATPQGDGFLTYSVKPKAVLANATKFDSKATIVFDTEAPIDTPLITNTLDILAPASSVMPFAGSTVTRPIFKVAFTGADEAGGSGLREFNLFVSDNDGPMQFFATGLTGNAAKFTGAVGHTYKFFSSAVDNVGNIEALAATPDATVQVVAPTFVKIGRSKTFTDSDGDKYTIAYNGPGKAKVALLDPDGDGKGAIDILQIDNSTVASSLTITVVKKPGGNGRVDIGDAIINGALASFTAKQSDLVVNGLTVTKTVGSIEVRDISQPDPVLSDPMIHLGGTAANKTQIVARNIADGTDIESTATITLLKAKSIGMAQVTAPKITKLTTTAGAMNADIVTSGAIGAISVTGGALGGDIIAKSFGAVSVTRGDFSGSLTSLTPGGATVLASLTITGGDFTGDIRLLGKSGAISIAKLRGVGGNANGATVNAAKIASLTIARDATNSLFLAGANLGADHALGGSADNGDTFAKGSIGPVSIGRNATGLVLGAGLNPVNSIFQDAGDTIIGGTASSIASIMVKGTADPTSYFAAGKFGKPVKIAGASIAPASDARFLVG